MGFSDHELIGFSRKVNHIRTNPKTVRSRNYKNYNSDNIIRDLDNSDWSRIYLASSINESVSAFTNILTNIIDHHVPYVSKRISSKVCPWLTPTLKNEMNLRDTYLRKYRKTKLEIDHSKYKQQRNKVNNMIKSCKQNFSKNLLTENAHDPEKVWKSLKKIYPTKTQNHTIQLLLLIMFQ